MDNEIHVALMPVNTISFLQLMNQGMNLTFMSYYLRNTFCKDIVATDSNSTDESGQNE